MSYLMRLKKKIAQVAPDRGATKVSKVPYVPFVAPESASFRLDFAANDLVPERPPDRETYEERAAIIEFDGLLDRKSAERCAHAIVFCRDCQHYIPQPEIIARSGYAHATPSGCKLGLTAPDSWPPIYSFTGWCCPSHAKPINI